MNEPPRVADYTTRRQYNADYAKRNREAIRARKREWRKRRGARLKQPKETQ